MQRWSLSFDCLTSSLTVTKFIHRCTNNLRWWWSCDVDAFAFLFFCHDFQAQRPVSKTHVMIVTSNVTRVGERISSENERGGSVCELVKLFDIDTQRLLLSHSMIRLWRFGAAWEAPGLSKICFSHASDPFVFCILILRRLFYDANSSSIWVSFWVFYQGDQLFLLLFVSREEFFFLALRRHEDTSNIYAWLFTSTALRDLVICRSSAVRTCGFYYPGGLYLEMRN